MRIGWKTDNPPEYYEEYLVQLDSGGFCICRWTDVNPFWVNLKTDWHWNIFDLPQFTKVVAWMLLPEPFKDEGYDDE